MTFITSARVAPRYRADVEAAARIAVCMLALTAATAVTVAAAAPAATRGVLGFTFDGVDRSLGEAASILANNLRILLALLLACMVARLARDARLRGRSAWVLGKGCDAMLVLVAAWHALLVGAGLGAYGEQMLRALVPHGIVELAAYSLALGLYVTARREPIARARLFEVALVSGAALGVAALLEVFVTP